MSELPTRLEVEDPQRNLRKVQERVLLRAALSYEEGAVGALMEFDQVTAFIASR